MSNKAAVLAWKFPVMNGIICEGDTLVKWNVPAHPSVPTQGEIDGWKVEWDAEQTIRIDIEQKKKQLEDNYRDMSDEEKSSLDSVFSKYSIIK